MFLQLHIQKEILIGASLEGLIAEIFAAKYPEETDGLVLMSSDCRKIWRNNRWQVKKDFAYLAGRVLLMLPEDDTEFSKQAQEELKELMTNPVIVNGIHKENIKYIREFIDHLPN